MSVSDTNRTEPTKTVPKSSSTMEDSGIDWKASAPKRVSYEDCMTDSLNRETWARIYQEVGARDEKAQREVRAAIYVYAAINGASRAGSYSGEIQLAGGKVISAAILSRVAGLSIRKFLRANMDESYEFFKNSRIMESYPRFISRAADLGIGPSQAFATADWLSDCALFTPEEKKAHKTSFDNALLRSKGARGGKSLESVESAANERSLKAQVVDEPQGSRVEW